MSVFDPDFVDYSPQRPLDADYPLLVRISGAPEALERIAAAAPGRVDVPPVNFVAWAASLAPAVANGLDPLRI